MAVDCMSNTGFSFLADNPQYLPMGSLLSRESTEPRERPPALVSAPPAAPGIPYHPPPSILRHPDASVASPVATVDTTGRLPLREVAAFAY